MSTELGSEQEKRIRRAREALCQAESELAALLQALETGERPDKRMISDVVRAAFEKLLTVKANLAVVLGEPQSP